ncbi:MAG: PEP-CTERM sorting domain-containing protein [Planctomycetaceae bacterium]|nr:PEP-CTERM sorting domain-containing protein [Planctomycetaceae bacterium]
MATTRFEANAHGETGDVSKVLRLSPGDGSQQALISSTVPEPGSLIVWGLGIVGLAGASWCRRQQSA